MSNKILIFIGARILLVKWAQPPTRYMWPHGRFRFAYNVLHQWYSVTTWSRYFGDVLATNQNENIFILKIYNQSNFS